MSALGKGYQSHPSASVDSPYFDLDYSGYQKENPSNNCLERKQNQSISDYLRHSWKLLLQSNHPAKSSGKKNCLFLRSTVETLTTHIESSPRLYFRPGDNWSVLLLSKYFQMWNMSTKRLKEGLLVIVPHPKLLTRLTDDGSNLRIVKLTHSWEEVMGCLMIESSWKIWQRMIGWLS